MLNFDKKANDSSDKHLDFFCISTYIMYCAGVSAHIFSVRDSPYFYIRACTGFDRDLEDGEAIRRLMRQIANLKLNANDNYELAAA